MFLRLEIRSCFSSLWTDFDILNGCLLSSALLTTVRCLVMAETLVESDYEDEISAPGTKSYNGSLENSDDDSLAGFEDDLDVEGDDEEFEVSNEVAKSNGEVRVKRKRKRADPTKRKRIRRILREDELTEVTISAQKEERERLRRLELQRSLAATAASSVASQGIFKVVENSTPANGSNPPSPVAIDTREKKHDKHVIVIDSDDEGETSSSFSSSASCCHSQMTTGNLNDNLIEIISSDSEVEIGESDDDDEPRISTQRDLDYDNSGLHVDDSINQVDSQGRVLVNVNHPADEEDIFLAPQVAKVIKPHQIGGIRFLYDNLVETLYRHKQSPGFGCILAHAMGLGKTLQVTSFIDIFLRHTSATKVLCIVPINTIQNWLAEFNMWLPPKPGLITNSNGTVVEASDSSKVRYRNFEVYLLGDSQRTTMARAKVIGEWNQHGGVLLMGYELYRLLSTVVPSMSSSKSMPTKKKKSPTPTEKINGEPEVIDLDEEEKHMELLIGVQKALCRPGADLVICDEGHRIKNDQANISQALKKIHSRRRVVLTGYPLQNNLQEYWCMVDFVRPNFLGNKQEFCNMFERPILNGQCTDSTPSDVKVMRYRSHVLHSLLEGFVQRRSQAVLMKCLPKKEEHIILVNMSSIQKELYNTFVERLLDSVGHINPIKGFHTCTKIWNHPDIFYRSLDMKNNNSRNESPLTILDDANGNGNSRSADRDGSTSNPSTSTANQQINPVTAGIQQNQVPGSTSSPYFPSSTNSAQTSTQALLRTAVQLRQMVSSQLSGQTVAMSQVSQSTTQYSVPVIQPVVQPYDRSSSFVEDMTWAKNLFKDYQPGVMENGGKLVVLMGIIEESLKLGEKVLVFSQSLSTLSVIEEFLSKRDVPFFPGRVTDPQKPSRWAKNKSYFRLDGNTSAQERERLINRFNAPDNTDVLLFMLSTRAGCLGINLVGASRVVVFDASWNPCHDVQAVCRVYRYGQVKPVHIYRLISTGTMEKKIYDRQISKQGMANRVVDELNPEANFTKQEIMKLICEKEPVSPASDLSAAADQFNDPVLVRLCRQCSQWMSKVPFKHDSLLVDKKELKLTKAEKREAKRGYEMAKRLAMQQQGARAYCPGVIQPVYNRTNQPNVPKPVNPVGAVTQQQNSLPHPSHVMQLPIPLASLIRAGVPVTQWGQTLPLAHLSTASTSTNTTPSANTSASKDDVVMIDLDELPSPTKPMQEPIQPQGNQSNSDLVKMARHAFPHVSPSFIGLLLNQGNPRGSSRGNVFGNAHGTQDLQTSSQEGNKKVEASDVTVASGNKKTPESASTAENSQSLRGLLAPNPSAQQVSEMSTPHAPPVVQDVTMDADKRDILTLFAPIPQDETSSQKQEMDGKTSGQVEASDQLVSQRGGKTDRQKSESYSPTPPTVKEVRNSLVSQGEDSVNTEGTKSSSPTPPIVKEGNNSLAPQGEGSVEISIPMKGENTLNTTNERS